MKDSLANTIRKMIFTELKIRKIPQPAFGKGLGSEGGENAQSKMAQKFFNTDKKMTMDELEKAADFLDLSVDGIVMGAKQIQMTGTHAKNITNFGDMRFDERGNKTEDKEDETEKEMAKMFKGMTPEARQSFMNLMQSQQNN